jgi:hypothetical protein
LSVREPLWRPDPAPVGSLGSVAAPGSCGASITLKDFQGSI